MRLNPTLNAERAQDALRCTVIYGIAISHTAPIHTDAVEIADKNTVENDIKKATETNTVERKLRPNVGRGKVEIERVGFNERS